MEAVIQMCLMEDQDWVTVNYEASAAENIMVIQKAFVRNDNNKNYVYKDDNGILKKQEISVGAAVDSGYSVIVKGGLSEDDLIAFPYGKDVKEGAKTKEVTGSDVWILIEKGDILCLKIYAWLFREYGHI